MKLFILHHLYVLAFGQTLDIERFDNFYLQGSTNINLTDFRLLINSDVCNVAKVGRVDASPMQHSMGSRQPLCASKGIV